MDVLRGVDEHRTGLKRPLHLAELVLDLRQAVVLLDDLPVVHLQLRRRDLVVAHQLVELVELVVVDHGDELRPVQHLAVPAVHDVLPQEPPEAPRLRRRDPEPRRVGPEPLDEVQELPVLEHVAVVEGLAPVHDDLLLYPAPLPVLVVHRPLHDPRLVAEPVAHDVVPVWRDRPPALRGRALPQALRDDVAVARVRDVAHVRAGVHAPVRDEYEPVEPERVHGLLHGGPQRVVVQRVAGEHPERYRDAVVVHEQPYLNDWLLPVLLADAELAQADHGFCRPVPALVGHLRLDVRIRVRNLEEEVRHVVEHGGRVAPDAALYARVHPADDLPGVLVQHGQRVVHVVAVLARDEPLVVFFVLVHRRALRRGLEDPAVHEKPNDPLEVVPYLGGVLDAREELAEAEGGEHRVEDARREPLRLAPALRVARLESDDPLLLRRVVDVGL